MFRDIHIVTQHRCFFFRPGAVQNQIPLDAPAAIRLRFKADFNAQKDAQKDGASRFLE